MSDQQNYRPYVRGAFEFPRRPHTPKCARTGEWEQRLRAMFDGGTFREPVPTYRGESRLKAKLNARRKEGEE